MSDESEFSSELSEFESQLRSLQPAVGLGEMESQLKSLSPRASRVDRDRTLFLAGRASAVVVDAARVEPNRAGRWQCATALSMTVAIGFALAWWQSVETHTPIAHDPAAVRNIDVVKEATEPPENEVTPPDVNTLPVHDPLPVVERVRSEEPTTVAIHRLHHPAGYLRLRRIALADGIDALPPPVRYEMSASRSPSTYGELRRRLMGTRQNGRLDMNFEDDSNVFGLFGEEERL